jgi:hypothetical protein
MVESMGRKGQSRGRRLVDSAIPGFAIQVLISTIGAILVGLIAVSIPAIVLAAVTKNTSGGNFADHVAEQPIYVLLNEPYFIAPIAAGFLLGLFRRRFFRSSSAAWVWVVPMVTLIWSVTTWRTGGFRPYWTDVWNNYFGSQCVSSECAYEWLVTAPFYTSVAYTLGWLGKNFARQKSAASVESPLGLIELRSGESL